LVVIDANRRCAIGAPVMLLSMRRPQPLHWFRSIWRSMVILVELTIDADE
jgi:hypothetical protein